jgi:hypothetical protein
MLLVHGPFIRAQGGASNAAAEKLEEVVATGSGEPGFARLLHSRRLVSGKYVTVAKDDPFPSSPESPSEYSRTMERVGSLWQHIYKYAVSELPRDPDVWSVLFRAEAVLRMVEQIPKRESNAPVEPAEQDDNE